MGELMGTASTSRPRRHLEPPRSSRGKPPRQAPANRTGYFPSPHSRDCNFLCLLSKAVPARCERDGWQLGFTRLARLARARGLPGLSQALKYNPGEPNEESLRLFPIPFLTQICSISSTLRCSWLRNFQERLVLFWVLSENVELSKPRICVEM